MKIERLSLNGLMCGALESWDLDALYSPHPSWPALAPTMVGRKEPQVLPSTDLKRGKRTALFLRQNMRFKGYFETAISHNLKLKYVSRPALIAKSCVFSPRLHQILP
ncbi:hypothetical protein AVEN_26004-1 [Araneus ventricosus]|uniref:Uncharacterized protein n=1 Tax=Araneus ventricosus TaxID=182803 RepID=A0A4Y2E5F4_ARAVE|nr:hypothetical protein AVEN_26004-1 [Araneus ventricosus]